MIAKIATIFVSIAIIAWLTVSMLVPHMTNSPPPLTLLNKTVVFTEENYEVGYPLTLRKGERLQVEVSGNGQPVDFRITDNQSSTLLEKTEDTFYSLSWSVPADGRYTFYVSTPTGNVRAALIVTLQ